MNIHRLRASLSKEELNTLNSREELRQQQLHSTICRAHLELQVGGRSPSDAWHHTWHLILTLCVFVWMQERVQARGEEFVTSLASLSEKLLHQLDDLLTSTGNLRSHLQVTSAHTYR